jgi:parallel beta-helix repeat protein
MAVVLVILIASALFFYTESASAAALGNVIVINSDGSVSGNDKILCKGNLYTLTGDLNGSVQNGRCLINVHKNNIIFDGAGHVLSGTGTGIAINLEGVSNVTVKNFIVDNFGDGVDITYANTIIDGELSTIGSEGNQILNNTFRAIYWGVALRATNSSIVSGNTVITLKHEYGINILSSHNNTFSNNTIDGGSFQIQDSSQIAFIDNTVNGKPFIYLEDASNQIIENAGQVWLVNCNNITVKNVVSLDSLRVSLQLSGTNNSRIIECSGRINLVNSHFNEISANTLAGIGSDVFSVIGAICLSSSNSCRIVGNEISATAGYCICLEYSHDNIIEGNKLSSQTSTALEIAASKQNRIYKNTITNSNCGIGLSYIQFPSITSSPPVSNNNLVYSNTITNCIEAIAIKGSHENLIFENNITASTNQAVSLFCSDDNVFYHNNFVNNSRSAYETHTFHWGMGFESYYSKNNTWADGYPSGGNYWSDYTGADSNNDGIGDTPYTVFENQTDHYPLMTIYATETQTQPTPTFTPPLSPIILPTSSPTITPNPTSTPTLQPSPSPTIPELPAWMTISLIAVALVALLIFKGKGKCKW